LRAVSGNLVPVTKAVVGLGVWLSPAVGSRERPRGVLATRQANRGERDLRGPVKTRDVARAAMYLCREFTVQNLPNIGRAFGRDPTTVMYAERKTRDEMAERSGTYEAVRTITARILRNG
jgi:Bacterial dnaA protein helix-turn-helix